MKTVIKGLGTACPAMYATQEEAYNFFSTQFPLKPDQDDLYRRILLDGRIKGRHFGIDVPAGLLEPDPDRRLARFLQFGRTVSVVAARKALAEARIEPRQLTGLVVNTCTGYLCPGLSSYIAEDLKLEPSIRFQDLMGMGCGGAMPNLDAAAGMLARAGKGPVLCIAVEICTATMFPSHEPELVVSNSIFSDGAAAAIVDLVPDDTTSGIAEFIDFGSVLLPEYRDELRYITEGGRLRNRLSRRVPVIGARAAAKVASQLLHKYDLSNRDISWWAIHPGGTQVIDQVGKHLAIADEALRFSRSIFERYGNMSSPSVLFVLRDIIDSGLTRLGQNGMLIAFGAGFSAFAALIRFSCDGRTVETAQSSSAEQFRDSL